MKRLIVKSLKPRNPLVAISHMRKAGVHRPGSGALRQQSRRVVRLEIEQLRPRSP